MFPRDNCGKTSWLPHSFHQIGEMEYTATYINYTQVSNVEGWVCKNVLVVAMSDRFSKNYLSTFRVIFARQARCKESLRKDHPVRLFLRPYPGICLLPCSDSHRAGEEECGCKPLTSRFSAIDNCPWTLSPHQPCLRSDPAEKHDKESIAGQAGAPKRKSSLNQDTKLHPRQIAG